VATIVFRRLVVNVWLFDIRLGNVTQLVLRAANAEAQAIAGDGLKGPKGMMWSQTPGLRANADGSVDVFFASTAPAGKESNWVPTSADGGFEVLFRFYGPEKPLFEKTWKLPDIEETK